MREQRFQLLGQPEQPHAIALKCFGVEDVDQFEKFSQIASALAEQKNIVGVLGEDGHALEALLLDPPVPERDANTSQYIVTFFELRARCIFGAVANSKRLISENQ